MNKAKMNKVLSHWSVCIQSMCRTQHFHQNDRSTIMIQFPPLCVWRHMFTSCGACITMITHFLCKWCAKKSVSNERDDTGMNEGKSSYWDKQGRERPLLPSFFLQFADHVTYRKKVLWKLLWGRKTRAEISICQYHLPKFRFSLL